MSNQIKQREQENPNDIDEVPVQADHFHRSEIMGVENVAICLDQQEGEQSDTGNHVDGVHTSHTEIEKKEDLRIVHELRG